MRSKFLQAAVKWIDCAGWVTPQGKLIPCKEGDHGEVACEIAGVVYDEEARKTNEEYYWTGQARASRYFLDAGTPV